ncbi:hypothetical protein AB5I41_08720 [Sphingomonas sp. MMS24-JH45]
MRATLDETRREADRAGPCPHELDPRRTLAHRAARDLRDGVGRTGHRHPDIGGEPHSGRHPRRPP